MLKAEPSTTKTIIYIFFVIYTFNAYRKNSSDFATGLEFAGSKFHLCTPMDEYQGHPSASIGCVIFRTLCKSVLNIKFFAFILTVFFFENKRIRRVWDSS